eukprot:1161401-Pelagomonas_calceolata.AAC.31
MKASRRGHNRERVTGCSMSVVSVIAAMHALALAPSLPIIPGERSITFGMVCMYVVPHVQRTKDLFRNLRKAPVHNGCIIKPLVKLKLTRQEVESLQEVLVPIIMIAFKSNCHLKGASGGEGGVLGAGSHCGEREKESERHEAWLKNFHIPITDSISSELSAPRCAIWSKAVYGNHDVQGSESGNTCKE